MTVMILACVATTLTPGCRNGPAGQQTQPPVPVLVGLVEQRDVPVQVQNIGTVEAYSAVDVKSLIDGALVNVHIQEGQTVKKGDLLFTIDPRPFEAALNQAEANLTRDLVQHENAVREGKRIASLYQRDAAPQEELDTAQTNVKATAASVQADQAAIEITRIQLGYCHITSPIDGVTGSLLVHEGNIVKAKDETLITIHQVQPIYVSFSVPQQYLPDIRRYSAQQRLRVDASAIQEGGHVAGGELAFVDNAIDDTTGTIRLKGLFPNEDQSLWPGQFVRVALTLTVDQGALVVPTRAIQVGQEGQFVYIVREDATVAPQQVAVERTVDGSAVVTGLRAGQRIVTDGQLRLFPGAEVHVQASLVPSTTSKEAAGS